MSFLVNSSPYFQHHFPWAAVRALTSSIHKYNYILQSSLSIRAEHEIYIGNYPVKFKESDVRKLFEDHQVTVGAIRMKHDGLKV